MQVATNLPITAPREPKEMLSVVKLPDGRDHVRINYSSLELLVTCKRKAHYVLNRGLFSREESEATLTGSAVHKAMEVWYCAPRSSRRKGSVECDDSQALMASGAAPLVHGQCVRCAAIFAYLTVSAPLAGLPPTEKRSQANVMEILNAYFDHYATDPWTLLSDADGPLCERKFEFDFIETPRKRITFFGTIDSVLYNEETKLTVVCDHKTTAALGADFYNRIKPNFQYFGYVAAAQRALNLNTNLFMSNGIQIAKHKRDFARQITAVEESDIVELRLAVEYAVDDYLTCRDRAAWPMTAPSPCTQWGGCQFRQVCELSDTRTKESVIASLYATGGQTS